MAKIIQIEVANDNGSMALHGLDTDGTVYILNGDKWEVLILSPK